jgi:hypothetical protein
LAEGARALCPSELAKSVQTTGLMPVDFFRGGNVSCDQATRMAINMSQTCCGGIIFFGSNCTFESTVSLPSRTGLQGGAAGTHEFVTGPVTVIKGPALGPAFLIESGEGFHLQNLAIDGHHSGIVITDAANVRFTNCAVSADSQAGGADDVDLSADGCDGCNVVFGSNNTALVIENSFWVWAEDSSFFFYPAYYANGSSVAKSDYGQRPAVIIRGNGPGRKYGVDTTYLLHFERITLSGGAFQYQQAQQPEQWPGFYDFFWITTEVSATPLLDVQVARGLPAFMGVQSVTIIDFNAADVMMPHYLRKYPQLTPASVGCEGRWSQCPGLVGVTALNCSHVPGCRLSGITIISASGYEGSGARVPAVRVFDGRVDSITVLSSQLTGATDVLDYNNLPVGATLSRSGGGLTIVGTANSSATANAQLTASETPNTPGSSSATRNAATHHTPATTTKGHALLLGESGEPAARLAIETNGAMRWGAGHSFSFDTTLHRMTSNTTRLKLAELKPAGVASANVTVSEAGVGDVVTATLSSLGDELIFLSARVAAPSRVLVLFRNEAPHAVDLPEGLLRVVVAKFG